MMGRDTFEDRCRCVDSIALKWMLRNRSGRCLMYLFRSGWGQGNLELGQKTLNFAMIDYPNLTTTIAYGVSYQIC